MKERTITRFAFIEAMLIEHGHIKRVHLERAFHLSECAATKLMRAFMGKYPKAMRYDMSARRYVKDKPGTENLQKRGGLAWFLLCAVNVLCGVNVLDGTPVREW